MPTPSADMQFEVVASPVPATAPETAPAKVAVRVDREYVAGGDWGTASSFIRTLPPYIDDLTAEFGPGVYDEQMVRDAHVTANLNILKAGVLETGVSLSPARPDADADGHELSVTICDAATRMFEELSTPLGDVLWDMSSALETGHRIAELTYRYDDSYGPKTLLVLDRMTVLARRATNLVVDPYMKLLGLLGVAPGQGMSIQTSTRLDELVKLPTFLPRQKFAIWTNRPKSNDPRGTSDLRPVYNPWWLKTQIWASYLKYLVQFGSASLVGETAPGAQSLPLTDSNGNVLLGTDGLPVIVTPEEAMQQKLLAFQSGTVLAVPNGAKVMPLEVKGNGEAFIEAINVYNAEITKGILTQSLATEEGKHSTRAAAGVHKDILDTLIRQRKQAVIRMIRFDILRNWVGWNWGDAAVELTPTVSLGETENEDFATNAAAIAELTRYGFLHRSQFPALDKFLGLPARDPEWENDPGPLLEQISPARIDAHQGEGLIQPQADPSVPAQQVAA